MTSGVVAGGTQGTAEAGAAALRSGGNAFDAAVAAGFAATAAEPGYTSLGGGGFLLAHTAAGDDILFDFFVDTPGLGRADSGDVPPLVKVTIAFAAASQVFHCGRASIAVPGVLAGFRHVHARLGRLPLADVVAPAVRMACEGVVLDHVQAPVLGLLEPILVLEDGSRRLYTPGGRLPAVGDRFLNPELGDLLRRVGEGDPDADLTAGPLSEALLADVGADAGAGLLTGTDLAGYRVVEREPLRVDYRGRTLLSNPAPSLGGSLVAAALAHLGRGPHRLGSASPDRLVAIAEAMVAVDAIRAGATAKGTTHVSVVDGEGNVATMTTSNGEGSGYVLPGTGVMLNNMLGEEDLHPDGFHVAAPGTRVPSMMAPTIVLGPGAVPELALGSGGSERIRSAILQVIVNAIDAGLDPLAAVGAPRIHWDGSRMQVEPGHERAQVEALEERWPVNHWPALDFYFGGVHVATPNGGAGDPRRGGVAAVVA